MKSRFICVVSSPNLWEDHHHLILSLRPVMGIQREGYQTVQSAGKIQNVPLAHLELSAAAEGEQWLLAGSQITAETLQDSAASTPASPRLDHHHYLFAYLLFFPIMCVCFAPGFFSVLFRISV